MTLNDFQRNDLNEMLTRIVYERIVELGDHVIDLGANHAHHTKELSRLVGSTGIVHAFEPNPNLSECFVGLSNVRLWPFAAGDEASTEHLHIPRGLDGWASVKDFRAELPEREFDVIPIKQITLDSLSEIDVEKITFVKVDVERRELQALRGMRRLLSARRAVFVVENVTDDISNFIAPFGYSVAPFSSEASGLGLSNSVSAPTEFLDAALPLSHQFNDALLAVASPSNFVSRFFKSSISLIAPSKA